MEATKSIYPKYKDKVLFIDVDVDLTEPEEAIRDFRDSNGYPVTFAIGNKDVLVNYKIISTSTKYGIKDGIIVGSISGILFSYTWLRTVKSYRQLSSGKWKSSQK